MWRAWTSPHPKNKGWISDARAKPHSPYKQAQWLNACIRDANISEIDWYRLAQNKAQWTKLVLHAYPTETAAGP